MSFFTALCRISEYLLYNSTLVLLLNPVVPEQNKRFHLYVIFHLDKSKIMLEATYHHECNHVCCEGYCARLNA